MTAELANGVKSETGPDGVLLPGHGAQSPYGSLESLSRMSSEASAPGDPVAVEPATPAPPSSAPAPLGTLQTQSSNPALIPTRPSPSTGLTFDATDLTLCSGVSPPPLLPVNPQHLESVLTSGTRMIKYPSKSSSKPAERLIRVDLNSLQIFWESKKKKSDLRAVDLHSIREIRLGQNTKAFELHGKRPDLQDRSFSVIYVASGEYKTLNLVAPSREDASTWVSGLHMLMAEADISEGDPAKLHYNMSTWLRRQFNAADTSNNGTLDLDEVTDLMRKLNIRLSKSEIKSTFKIADVGKFGSLKFAAFERLYRVLRFRPEVSELFSALSRTKPALITYEEFKVFAQQTQKNDWTDERCYEVYSKYAGANSQEMNVDHFSAFLLASTNSIFNKTHNHVFQDMSRPMTDYFINTSHNTYLLKDQLAGESSVEGYIRALQRGCRCVELDCFDGNNGQPVIYHGMTLVGKLLFKDVIEAIGKYAFVATPYPLILSLESQCGPEQQAAMANILREYLGDYLLQRPLVENATSLPSPEDLKNKIIIKGKILASGKSEMEYETEDEEEVLSPGVATSPLAQVSNLVDSGTAPTLVRKPTTRKSRNSQGAEESAEAAAQRKRAGKEEPGLARKKSSPKLSRKHIVAKPLLELLVYCQGVSFESFAAAAELFLFNHMCSLSEKKSIALIQRQRAEYIAFTKRSLTRIYPAGTRVTSTNYDPIPHWAVGAQMVAMNYQTFDKGMQLNTGLFSLNGRCGYVLKPTALRNKAGPKPDPISLTIKIISGQQLPKPKDSTGKTVIDPYVELEIAGGDTDCIKYRTKAINNNGFNPMWKEEFRFNIADPEMALLRFSIFDMDVKMTNDFIGSYTIPIQSLEQGYRHVPVYNWKGDLIRFSTLFIYVRIISVPSTKSSSSTAPPTAALQFGNPLAGTSEPAQLTTAVVGNPVPTTGTTTTQPQQANGLIGTVYAR